MCGLQRKTQATVLYQHARPAKAYKQSYLDPCSMFFKYLLKGSDTVNRYYAYILALKAPIMAAADDIHKYFFIVFQRK